MAEKPSADRLGWPELTPDRPVLMGVLNVTPNSFSDGGLYAAEPAAVARALEIVQEGAAIVDIGGESTHPKAAPTSGEAEAARVVPVIAALAGRLPIPISIDTYRAATADAALRAGARIVNDIWGLQKDPAMAETVAGHGAGLCIMHNRAAIDPGIDIVADVLRFLERSLSIAIRSGIATEQIIIDPGIGFGKTFDQNLAVLARLDELATLGQPILVGASRKGFIGAITGKAEPADRLQGTVAAHVGAVLKGAAVIRAHDIAAHRDALAVAGAIRRQCVA